MRAVRSPSPSSLVSQIIEVGAFASSSSYYLLDHILWAYNVDVFQGPREERYPSPLLLRVDQTGSS